MHADRSLTPADAAVAVRSFPRRFRGVFVRPDDADDREAPDEAAARAAHGHLDAATALVEALPALAARSGDVETPRAPGLSVPALLDRLDRAAETAAARIESVPSDRWGDDLEALQDAIAAIATHLRAASETLRT